MLHHLQGQDPGEVAAAHYPLPHWFLSSGYHICLFFPLLAFRGGSSTSLAVARGGLLLPATGFAPAALGTLKPLVWGALGMEGK